MKKNKRTIENYQILQLLEQYQKQYSILLARNLTDKKQYILKKLHLQQNNQTLYHALLNQARILKLVKHENIVPCFRMFKTNSNLYIVYGYKESNTLEEILEAGPKVLTFVQKQTIAKQLCLAIAELHKNLVIHLNINPESIYLDKKLNLTLRQFMFAMEIPQDGELDIKRKIPKSEFVAPEVRRGIACLEGDIYSFGKVLEQLQFGKCKKDQTGNDHKKRAGEYQTMIEGMTAKDRYMRWTINDVYQCIFSKLKKVKRLRSLSQNIANSRLSSQTLPSGMTANSQLSSQILQKVLQQRNMSMLLVWLFKTVAVTVKLNSEWTVIFGTLLLKKSTKMLANLGKYLHYGKNDLELDINYKDYGKFTKSADYFKICELVDKEIGIQKKQFDLAAQTIFTHNSHLFKRDDFHREMRDELVSPVFMAESAKQYLWALIQKTSTLTDLDEKTLSHMVIISHIASSRSYQFFFRLNFPADNPQMAEQEFMKKLAKMPKIVLIQTIKKNLQQDPTDDVTSIGRTKNSITPSSMLDATTTGVKSEMGQQNLIEI